MAIDKDEIEKYIFDPENPRQCKAYNALLTIAKKEPRTFLSPDFVKYFISDKILTKEFHDAIWDKPNDYINLDFFKKISLYINLYTELDFIDYLRNIDINISHLENKYKIFNNLVFLDPNNSSLDNNIYDNNDTTILIKNEKRIHNFIQLPSRSFKINNLSNYNLIIFSKDIFSILKTPISRKIIFITLEEKIDKFIEYSKDNTTPIFLKKVDDLELLMNVLENDLKQNNNKNIKSKNKPKEDILTLNSIKIKNFFSIKKEIELNNLKNKKEIYIVGENGDGKTLLLQAITVGLKGTSADGLKAFRDIEDQYTIEIENKELCENNFLAYGALRNSVCQMKEDKEGFLTLFTGEYDLKSPIDWLLTLDYSEKSEKTNVISVKEAKKLLQVILNSDIQIDIIPPSQVTFTEKGSIVDFKQLSAGYKGVITILCDLIERLSQKQDVENVADFQGIVLIDEVELHLHPKWKYRFMNTLRDTFPLIQFIATTHSPTVILGASKEAVFYKIYKDDGEVKISEQIANEGYTNNSLISSPLFDLDTMASRDYDKKDITDDNYVNDKIYKVIEQRLKNDIDMSEEDIFKFINDELDKT